MAEGQAVRCHSISVMVVTPGIRIDCGVSEMGSTSREHSAPGLRIVLRPVGLSSVDRARVKKEKWPLGRVRCRFDINRHARSPTIYPTGRGNR